MTIRVLLAVVVTVALLASAMPVVEEAQQLRAEHALTDSAESVEQAAATLARRNDPVPPGIPAARLRVRITVPETPAGTALRIGTFTSAGTARGNGTGNGITTIVPGNPSKRYPVDIPIRIAGTETPVRPEPLVLREDTVLTLEYRLVDGRPTVVVTRGFKS